MNVSGATAVMTDGGSDPDAAAASPQSGGNSKPSVIRPTDAQAIRLAKTLTRTARHGALAVVEPETGRPLVSRVGTATDADGAPIILVSMLSAHTRALLDDPRCSLLLGEPGKGDALAHPRITLLTSACQIARDTAQYERAERRYLNKNPKAKLYAGLGDFRMFRLDVEGASLNGGFGKAFVLTSADLVTQSAASEAIAQSEQSALDHMNADHRDAIDLYARHFAGATTGGWVMTGIDVDGFDIASGDDVGRVFFDAPLSQASEMRVRLVEMAKSARDV